MSAGGGDGYVFVLKVSDYKSAMFIYWDSSEQWSASIEVCACFCSGV